ncbi:hypothetical protein HXX76_000359 [Chlamydomonas incerta]|uniref:Uncharacterized protein n=1 Tax=Chlamydomonas incerta TaxID=51695 RepID=A0A835WE65_CHLIN|nr:hypothetical protein HXX76_000359 [Chlamydomonas incerta]|eukprot:KAG2445753.1 hypothetical protein HXX76_000359 [Chlamydomonas incerta]
MLLECAGPIGLRHCALVAAVAAVAPSPVAVVALGPAGACRACHPVDMTPVTLPSADKAALRQSCKAGLCLADRQISRLELDSGWPGRHLGPSVNFEDRASPWDAQRERSPMPRAAQARYVAGVVSRGARPHELLLRPRPEEESADLGNYAVRLFTALRRGGPSAPAAAPPLTRLNLEAVPLNAAMLAALAACTPQLSSLQLRGYDLRRENGVSGRYVWPTAGGDEAGSSSGSGSSINSSSARAGVGVPALLRHAAPSLHHLQLTDYDSCQLSAPLAQCTRLESFSLDWQAPFGVAADRARPSRPLLVDLMSVLTALGALNSLELQFPRCHHPNQPTELASAADAAEGRYVIPAGGLQRLRRLRLVDADPPKSVLGAALSRWLGPRPALTVLHLLSSKPGPADLRAISEIPGLKDLMVYSIVDWDVAEAGCDRGDAASTLTVARASLQPGSLPLPPNLQRLGLWRIGAAVLSALALPRSLTQLHLHKLLAKDYSPQLVDGEAQEDNKICICRLLGALEVLARCGCYAGSPTDREMAIRDLDWRRPLQLEFGWFEPARSDKAGQEDWSWRRVFQALGRLRVQSAPPPPAGEGGEPAAAGKPEAAAATPLQRLHLNLTGLSECDAKALVEELPQLQYLELECELASTLPHIVLHPLDGLAELRTLVLHPGMGRNWEDWVTVDDGFDEWYNCVEWALQWLLKDCPRLTRVQLLLMDVYVDEEDDDPEYSEEDVRWATELEDLCSDALSDLRAFTIPALRLQEGPRQGAEIVVGVRVKDFGWMESEGLRAFGL